MANFHIPVFLDEILDLAEKISPQRIFDGTLGDGGHSLELLNKFENSKLWATDRDPDMLARAKKRLEIYKGRTFFYNQNFSDFLSNGTSKEGLKFDFALLDLGIASFHFDQSDRGFSFQDDEPLDMRLDKLGESALDIIKNYSEKELADIIYKYGQERSSRKIARLIHSKKEWSSAKELADAVASILRKKQNTKSKKRKKGKRNIHPATKTFQALRIKVNNELEVIEDFLGLIPRFMTNGGILAVISFHSLEDRLIKWFMKFWEKPGSIPPEIEIKSLSPETISNESQTAKSKGKVLFKKPLVPGESETKMNPRCRSAKLRAFQFLSDN